MNGFIHSALIGPLRRKFIITRAHRHSNAVAITFDDGPHPVNTLPLLALLKEANVTATFFLVGFRIECYGHIVEEMVDDGHEIGIHSFYHRTMATAGFKNYAQEIKRTAALIEEYTHRRTQLFRSPFGEYNLRLLWLMIFRRLRCILWSVDHHDYSIDDKDTLVRLIKETPLASGDILLFHDYSGATIEAMPAIIRDIRSRGFKFVTISQLLSKGETAEQKFFGVKNIFRGMLGRLPLMLFVLNCWNFCSQLEIF